MDVPEFVVIPPEVTTDGTLFHMDMYSMKDMEQRFEDYSNSHMDTSTMASTITSNAVAYDHPGLRLASNFLDDSVGIKVESIEDQYTSIMNMQTTDDESMAVEALRQLGNSTIYNSQVSSVARIETKTPRDLPLLPCTYCDLQFRNTADLNNHMSICKSNSQYLCQICHEPFEKETDLNNHLVQHTIVQPYNCIVCNALFLDKKDLLEHMSLHGNNANANVCQVCSLTFSRASSLTNHMKIHNYQPGRAILSKSSVANSLGRSGVTSVKSTENLLEILDPTHNLEHEHLMRENLQENLQGNLQGNLQENLQGTLQENLLQNLRHETLPHENLEDEESQKKIILPSISNLEPINHWHLNYDGFKTEINFDIAQDMSIEGSVENNFLVKEPLPYKTETSEKTPNTTRKMINKTAQKTSIKTAQKASLKKNDKKTVNKNLISNMNGSVKPHVCIYCKKCFTREKALMSHLKIHNDTLEMENYFPCDKCNLYFNEDVMLSKHLSVCHKQKDKQNGMDKQNISDRQIHLNGQINSNRQINLNDQIHSNRQVNPNRQNNSNKDSYCEKTPTKSKNNKHSCTECEKKFSTKQKLFRHLWIHRKKTHTCETCSINFEKQEDLDGHRLSSHQGSSAYICTECGKNFSSRQGLWEHGRIHGSDSNLYKCTQCLKTFTSRQGYLIHKRKHNDERPYGCRFCWKAFRDGGTLRKHERIHTGERPHVCPICSKAFNQKVVLREHIRWLHTASIQANIEGLYNCAMCDGSFIEKDELCAHIVKHSDHLASLAKDASKNNAKVIEHLINETRNSMALTDNLLVENILAENSMTESLIAENSMAENFITDNSLIDNSITQNSVIENAMTENSLMENSTIENTLAENSMRENSMNNIKTPVKRKCAVLDLNTNNGLNNLLNLSYITEPNLLIECDICGANFISKVQLADHIRIHI